MLRAIIFLTALTFADSVRCQFAFDAQWHFGEGTSIDFTSGTPVTSASSIQASTEVEPAVLCNPDGSVFAYADGVSVYNSAGSVVLNGTFESVANESIFSPIPGSTDRAYLFRSGPSIGVTWSIIDMTLNDGEGGISDDEKSINIGDLHSQLMTTSHANLLDRWLITANNNEGSGDILEFHSFEISNDGLAETSTFSQSYSWAGWYDSLDEARMSPSCVKIATSHKGHYITLFEFDNSSGEVTTGFEQAINGPGGLSTLNYLDFSPSGDHLYLLIDELEVRRYDANTFNQIDFMASEETLFTFDFGSERSHIKRGPDNKIYLLNPVNLSLDEISDPDEPEPILTEEVITLEDGSFRFFPNTINSCVSQPVMQVTDVCVGDSTYFYTLFGEVPDSIYWVIDGPDQIDTVFSQIGFVELLSPGEYDTDVYYLFDSLWVQLEDVGYVFEQPVVELGEDIVACQGETVQLSVGKTPFTVLWNTGEETPIISTEFSGTYAVNVVNGACVTNDDIEVLMIQEPILDIEDIVICNEQIDVDLIAEGEWIDSYLWEDGSTLNDTTVSSSGVYVLTGTNTCFSTSDSASVTYVFFPESLVDSSFAVCADDTLFVNTPYEPGNITWSTGENGQWTGITGEGEFTVEVEYLGCTSSDFFTVDRIPYVDAETLIMPNVITPNKDDTNELFRPFNPELPDLNPCTYDSFSSTLTIYNRWGNELHRGFCIWDGDAPSSDQVSEGTYFYLVNLESKCLDYESAKEIHGTLEVLR